MRMTPRNPSPRRVTRSGRTLSSVVGASTYSLWVGMLRSLVPDGRTHRLSVVIAGMLQHAARLAVEKSGRKLLAGSVEASLLRATEEVDPELVAEEIGDVVQRLFRDAGVSHRRVSARGEKYSILEGVFQEFVSWHDMPWE